MATSGSTDWSLNRAAVIKGALRKLGVLASGGSPTSNQTSDAADALNALVKAFQADGMPLWKMSTYTFTTVDGTSSYTVPQASKMLKVYEAFYTVSGGIPTPMNIYNRYDFYVLPQTSTIEGTPVNLYYQPNLTTGTIRLWPTPDNSTTSITVHGQFQYEDMDADANDFDFPAEWIQALIYNLAWALAPEYGIPPTDRGILQKEAEYWHQYALSMGSEESSIYIRPEREF